MMSRWRSAVAKEKDDDADRDPESKGEIHERRQAKISSR
jgi:hypothetical protein